MAVDTKSRSAKAENLENGFDEIAATILEMVWGDGKKKTKLWLEEEEEKSEKTARFCPYFLVMSSVLWSGQSCGFRGPVDENILVMVIECTPSEDMVKLHDGYGEALVIVPERGRKGREIG